MRGKHPKHRQPQPKGPTLEEADTGSASVLPMEIQTGDRFTAQGFEW